MMNGMDSGVDGAFGSSCEMMFAFFFAPILSSYSFHIPSMGPRFFSRATQDCFRSKSMI